MFTDNPTGLGGAAAKNTLPSTKSIHTPYGGFLAPRLGLGRTLGWFQGWLTFMQLDIGLREHNNYCRARCS